MSKDLSTFTGPKIFYLPIEKF